jgi:hypothetical protein
VQILRSGREQLPSFGALVTCKVLQQELCVCHTDQGGQPGAFAKVRSWPEAQEGHLKQKVQEVVADDHLQGLAGWSSCLLLEICPHQIALKQPRLLSSGVGSTRCGLPVITGAGADAAVPLVMSDLSSKAISLGAHLI